MRILHVAYIYPPILKVADGITNVVYNVTKELARRGHQVVVYTSNLLDLHGKDSINANHLIINRVDVHYSRSLWRYKTFIIAPSMIPLLSNNIDNFDVVHIHDCRSFQGISTYLFAKTKKIPYVFQPHGSYLSPLPESPTTKIARITLDGFISEKLVKNASKVVVLSRVEAEQYRGMGVPEEKIAVIPNGIDLSEYADLPPKGSFKKKFNIDENEKIVLYLGRIHRLKGIDFLVRSFAYLIKNGTENSNLVIAGPDDGYLDEVKFLVNSLGISDLVLFTGILPEKDKISAYVDSSICTYLSPFEPFGLVTLEVAACGTPIIVSRGTHMARVVDERKFGFSVKYDDTYELAETMRKVLNDNDLLREMGQKGRKFIFENFNWTDIVVKLEKVYEDVVKRN